MKKLICMIVCMALCMSVLLTTSAYAEPSIIYYFDSVDDLRKLILASQKHNADEYDAFLEDADLGLNIQPSYDTAKILCDRFTSVPFVNVQEGTVLDSVAYPIIYDPNLEIWTIKYEIDGVVYSFNYSFRGTSAGDFDIDAPIITCEMDGCEPITLSLLLGKYKGSCWINGVVFVVEVVCDSEEKIDFSAFEIGELSLTLDSATTVVTTTATPTEAPQVTTAQEAPSNVLPIALAASGVAVLAVGSGIVWLAVRKRKNNS